MLELKYNDIDLKQPSLLKHNTVEIANAYGNKLRGSLIDINNKESIMQRAEKAH